MAKASHHYESRVVSIAPQRMFDLVADVERYPEFLPLMREARIVQRDADGYETEQVLAVGLLAHRFRTHTVLQPPHSILVTSADRGFRRFDIRWAFAPESEGGCRIAFTLDCEVRSIWLKPLGDVLAAQMALTTVNAFIQRAHALDLANPA
ncbi:MAG: type II toxin-antitoxin system RatA family toxin [Candidatus Contendobacter sp.]|nr:type II toxin-antitoxin system RatA family toxin [Candidatus Contendobacter sp.]MDG4557408.1 type II toxin-antitoxin system RatA family toxin [Candidatus Contendobacter sp.]